MTKNFKNDPEFLALVKQFRREGYSPTVARENAVRVLVEAAMERDDTQESGRVAGGGPDER